MKELFRIEYGVTAYTVVKIGKQWRAKKECKLAKWSDITVHDTEAAAIDWCRETQKHDESVVNGLVDAALKF